MPFKNHHYLPTSRHITYSVAIKHFPSSHQFPGKSNPISKVHYPVCSLIEVVRTKSYHRMKIAWKPLVAQNRDAYLRSPPPKQLRASMMEFFRLSSQEIWTVKWIWEKLVFFFKCKKGKLCRKCPLSNYDDNLLPQNGDG